MLTRVKDGITEHSLLETGDSVLVALSGGPDSVALLHILSRLRRSMKLSLRAVYINHGLRPEAAAREERFCARLCKKLKVELDIVREDVPVLAGRARKSTEETARDLRYRLFDRLAGEHQCDRIALGHHADDNVETILFRIIRGTGKRGLGGIPIRRDKIIRPLLYVTKQEILAYLKKEKLRYCIDLSNCSFDYTRNYIRNELLPLIRKELNPAVDRALLNLAETSREEEQFLDKITAGKVKKILSETVGGKIELDLKRFRTYDIWLRRRVLRYCITKCLRDSAAPGKSLIDRLDKLVTSGGKALSLAGRLDARIVDDRLVIGRRGKISFRVRLSPGEDCHPGPLRMILRCRRMRFSGRIERKRRALKVLVDYKKLKTPLTVRNLQPGDRFRPLGSKGTKKAGDYLTDRKVAPVYRDEIPVVCDEAGIIWLVGYEIADRVKIDSSTSEVLKIESVRPGKKAYAAV